MRAHILMIGAGGSGSSNAGGGGGAGELLFGPSVSLAAGSYSVAVGGETAVTDLCGEGVTGADTSLTFSGDTITAKGGGGGAGKNGGSGGGGSSWDFHKGTKGLALTVPSGSAKTEGVLSGFRSYGNDGSTATQCTNGLGLTAGGGGAGAAGSVGTDSKGGSGGNGLSSVTIGGTSYDFASIFGAGFGVSSASLRFFAGGGGGGKWGGYAAGCISPYASGAGSTIGTGGTGGGGGAGSINGVARSGGGGAGGLDACRVGGTGGSGIVLIAFDTQSCPTGQYKSGSTCTNCPAGKFRATTGATAESDCVTCGAGTYSSWGDSACSTCAANRFSADGASICCARGQYTVYASASCVNCPLGSYGDGTGTNTQCDACAAGTFAGTTGKSVCDTCTPGTYSGTGVSACTPCSGGTYRETTGGTAQTDCSTCDKGTYSGGGLSVCTKCDVGSFGDTTGGTAQSDCDACVAGTYAPTRGLTECLQCPAGTYSPDVSASSAETCVTCAMGTSSTGLGMGSSTACSECASGSYSRVLQLRSSPACETCLAGTGSTSTQASPAMYCTFQTTYALLSGAQIPPSPFTSSAALTTGGRVFTVSAITDGAGNEAYRAFDGSSVTTWQSAASYTLSEGSGTLLRWGAGQTTPGGWFGAWLQIQVSTPIALGRYNLICSDQVRAPHAWTILGSNDGNVWDRLSRVQDTFDTASSYVGKDPPRDFFPGQDYSQLLYQWRTFTYFRLVVEYIRMTASDRKTVINEWRLYEGSVGVCPAGSYCPESTKGSRIYCPANRHGPNTAQTASSACQVCPDGQEPAGFTDPSLTLGATGCSQCSTGKAGTGGTCTTCTTGSYADTTALTSCTLCTAGTFSGATGASTSSTCTPCTTGRYSVTAGASISSTCTLCAAGTFSAATGASSPTTCESCAPGTFGGAAGLSVCASCPPNSNSETGFTACRANAGYYRGMEPVGSMYTATVTIPANTMQPGYSLVFNRDMSTAVTTLNSNAISLSFATRGAIIASQTGSATVTDRSYPKLFDGSTEMRPLIWLKFDDDTCIVNSGSLTSNVSIPQAVSNTQPSCVSSYTSTLTTPAVSSVKGDSSIFFKKNTNIGQIPGFNAYTAQLNTGFTLSFWYNMRQDVYSTHTPFLFAAYSVASATQCTQQLGSTAYDIRSFASDSGFVGKKPLMVRLSGNGNIVIVPALQARNDLDGAWHLFTMATDTNNRWYFWRDGVLTGCPSGCTETTPTKALANFASGDTPYIFFGGNGPSPCANYVIEGGLDDFRVYPMKLTDSEVQELFTGRAEVYRPSATFTTCGNQATACPTPAKPYLHCTPTGTPVCCGTGEFFVSGTDTACRSCATVFGASYNSDGSSSTCTSCPAGQSVSGTACATCAAGTYTALSGQSACLQCGPGTYAVLTGRTVCTSCDAGTYNPSSGASLASACATCTVCAPGSYVQSACDATRDAVCAECAPEFTAERRYPPKKFDSVSSSVAVTFLGQSVRREILTLDRSGVTYGDGLYEVYQSTVLAPYTASLLFNRRTDDIGGVHWAHTQYTSGTYNGGRFIVNGYNGDWFVVKMPMPTLLASFAFTIRSGTGFPERSPGAWKCYGSNNGVDFEEIVAGSQMTKVNEYTSGRFVKTLNPMPTKAYSYYGWTVNRLFGDATVLNFAELEISGRELLPTYSTTTDAATCTPCTICPAGQFTSPSCTTTGDAVCADCAAGTYASAPNLPAADQCTLCVGGTYSAALGAFSSASCTLCGTGAYSTASGAIEAATCTLCVPGTFATGSGLPDSAKCTLCRQGTYSTTVGAIDNNACQLSSAGTYCTGTGVPDRAQCLLCGTGTYSTASAAILDTTCKQSVAGTFCTGTGIPTSAECLLCGTGTYSTAAGAIADTTCEQTVPGTYCTGSGIPARTECPLCGKGTYSTASGAIDDTTCSQSIPGTYCTGTGIPDSAQCLLCGTGTYSTASGAILDTICKQSVPGTYCTGTGIPASAQCTLCGTGTYSTASGAILDTICKQSVPGTYCTGSGIPASAQCPLCGTGTYSTASGAIEDTTCQLAVPGTFCTGTGTPDSAQCTLCRTGTYSTASGPPTSATCALCVPGTFSTGTGIPDSAECTLCNPGTYSTGSGTTLASVCALCSTGAFSTGSGIASSVACEACTAGTFSGTTGASSPTTCAECTQGSYSSTQASVCTDCPESSSTPAPAATSLDDCVCNQGLSGTPISGCQGCPKNSYCSSGSQTPCPAGYFSLPQSTLATDCKCQPGATFLPTLGCTCDDGLSKRQKNGALGDRECAPCPSDSYCSLDATTPCPANSKSPANSSVVADCRCDAGYYWDETAKTCPICPAGSYCKDNQLYPCPVHTKTLAPGARLQRQCVCNAGFTCKAVRDVSVVIRFQLSAADFNARKPAIQAKIAQLARVPVENVVFKTSSTAALPGSRRLLLSAGQPEWDTDHQLIDISAHVFGAPIGV